MKKHILNMMAALALAGGISGCGDSFLDTDYSKGIDVETGLSSVDNIATALNGTYYRLFAYQFAGNYATNIGDVVTDVAYWNGKTGHWDGLYKYSVLDTDTYLLNIWRYGYKVIDNAARVIEASQNLYESESASGKAELDLYMAEAYALRGYAELVLTNVYGHQVKVNGTDFSGQPGIIIVDKPVPALSEVGRSTVGQSYEAVLSDFNNALSHFAAAGGDRQSLVYFGEAAVHGLLARTYLYLEQWDNAKAQAQQTLNMAQITTLHYTKEDYAALYASETSNTESIFALAISSSNNWSANSSGTLWSTYNLSPSPKLLALYGANDCRTGIFGNNAASTPQVPIFNGGKFKHTSSGNPARGTNYIVNAPELFLIIAEASLKSATPNITDAQNALLTVAKRNADIQTVADLPATSDGLMAFIKDERARELFQEGFRLYDLRRWDEKASVYAFNSPAVSYTYNNYQISNLVYPIPAAEINAGFGTTQNDWASTLPKAN
ncbi:MAG: RagB/SusD family nutrient uptake outer membrane protein [Prevotellaceae bacterium]|jgi:hypothetical protein|nr:RagB/SusD family nutrient uptake outer membrane protein [Prevotellaceae bacterium]